MRCIGNGVLEPGMQVMTKPFVMEVLASRIRQIIENGNGDSKASGILQMPAPSA
jgi:DNA-binding response OmpR family regulator